MSRTSKTIGGTKLSEHGSMLLYDQPQGDQEHVDQLDAEERDDDAAHAVDQQVAAQTAAAPSGR